MQLDFFSEIGQSTTISENEVESAPFGWSYSRRQALEQCPRRYYYAYYGANARTAKAESEKETLRVLKKLSNLSLRCGQIAHSAIRTDLKRLKAGQQWSQEQMVRWATEIFRRDLEFSRRRHIEDLSSDRAHQPALLLEFYYGYAHSAELFAQSEQQLVTALTNLRTAPVLAPFRAGATREGAMVESSIKVIDKYFSLHGRIDLAFPTDDGRFVVADWKMGNPGDGEAGLQLMSYGAAAVDKLQCAPEDIDLYRVQLHSGVASHFEMGRKQILRTRARIIQDVEWMKALDEYGRNAAAEVFTPCGQWRICAMCPFQALCPKEPGIDDRDEYSDTEAGD